MKIKNNTHRAISFFILSFFFSIGHHWLTLVTTLPSGFMQEEVQWVAWKKFLTFEK